MSDFVASVLGLGFTLVVCLLAVQALLSPWLRVRRTGADKRARAAKTNAAPSTSAGTAPHISATAETTVQVG